LAEEEISSQPCLLQIPVEEDLRSQALKPS